MPSEHQPAGKSDFANVYERAFSDELDLNPWPLINGIHTEDQALSCHQAAHSFGATKQQKEQIARRLARLRG